MMHTHKLTMIVATDLNNGIGKNNQLPWHLSEDLRRFKKITTGHPILMGRKTWESLPKRPLPNRHNIILTRNKNYKAQEALVINDIKEIKQVVPPDEEIFIIGGAEIYNLLLPYISTVHLTLIKNMFDCDAFLSQFNPSDYTKITESEIYTDEKSEVKYQYITLQKKYNLLFS